MQQQTPKPAEPAAAPTRSDTNKAWEAEAKRILKAELARQGLTYKGLVNRLAALGIKDDERAIANRISRGKFQFTFFLQCMRAIGVNEVDLRGRRRP
jgi:hypothetical protein